MEEEEWEQGNSGTETDCSVSEEFASSRAARQAAKRGRGKGKARNPSGQRARGKGRGSSRGRGAVREPIPRDQDRQNVTNWNFLEYMSSPEAMMPLSPAVQQAEKRKAGRPLGSSNKKQYTSSARRAIEEATRLLDGESFLDEEKDIENDSLDEGEVNDNPEDEDEPEDFLVYVSEGEEEQQEAGSGYVRAGGRGGGLGRRRGGMIHISTPEPGGVM